MDDLISRLLFYDDLVLDECRAARKALAEGLIEDAELERAFNQWQRARRHLGERFRRDLPERRLLVLYALAGEPAAGTSGEMLSEPEQRALEAARPQIEQALQRHPALSDIVEEIRRERVDFETVWDEQAGAQASPAPARAGGNSSSTGVRPPRRAAARPPKRRPIQRWGWRVAGGVALVAFVVVLFLLVQRDRSTVVVTAEGEAPRIVKLADGSTVRLMPGATLAYVDPGAEAVFDRQATLQSGRAFFDIVPAQQGFLVETPTARVRVLGTRFGVTAEEHLTRVVLAFGRVALTSKADASQPVTLQPGQGSRVARGALPSTPLSVERLSEALSWTGLFVFRNAPVRDIVRQLTGHYGVSIEVASPLQDNEVTGTFDRSRPLRETLRTLATALNAEVRSLPGGGYRLVPGGP